MTWGALGRFLVRSLPTVIETVQAVGQAHGADEKRAAVVAGVINDLKATGLEDQVLLHPKVTAALIRANDALVDVHDTIAAVQLEATSVASNAGGPLGG